MQQSARRMQQFGIPRRRRLEMQNAMQLFCMNITKLRTCKSFALERVELATPSSKIPGGRANARSLHRVMHFFDYAKKLHCRLSLCVLGCSRSWLKNRISKHIRVLHLGMQTFEVARVPVAWGRPPPSGRAHGSRRTKMQHRLCVVSLVIYMARSRMSFPVRL